MEAILEALKSKQMRPEDLPDRFRRVQAQEVQAFVDALLASDLEDKLELSRQIIVESGEEIKKMTKLYNKKAAAKKKEDKKAADEADEEDETLTQIQPKLTRTLYTKVTRSKINAKHAFFGTHEVPCRHNIYYYFGFQEGGAGGAGEYSKIRCSYETNNYIQVTYNEETKNTSILVPERAYFEAMIEFNREEEKVYTFIPVNIGFTKNAKVTHACILIIHNETLATYFFDPNGTSLPDNATVDGHYKTICDDYELSYQRIGSWNPRQVSMQFSAPYRENFNDGDCFILSIHFAKLLQETKTQPKRLMEDLCRMEVKKRKCMINKFYAEFAAYIPKKKVAPRKKKESTTPAPAPAPEVVSVENLDEEEEEEAPPSRVTPAPKRPTPRVVPEEEEDSDCEKAVSEDDDYED